MSDSATSRPRSEKEIFFEALERPTPQERAAFLDGACGTNPLQRAKVEALLADHFQQDSFMKEPAAEAPVSPVPPTPPAEADSFFRGVARTLHADLQESPCPMIGRYKLLEKLGEGGFGEVWMAEQREPVKRRVALKIIKLGMDSRQIVARFEAERQVLAMMDHPNIAKIFDADVTDAGRPYFVMELVRGIKITDYCDQNQLPTRERLNLFILVCQAIQHAHQKGIIHRDIKPSNILVTLHDGVPVPKVIDFGIAKATQQELTDKTVFTQFQQFIGTPAYISPEQAEMSGLDIDTRADIYSLGVLLYELLVGQTPFDAKEMMQRGLDALRKIIRETEPLRPSTKLNTLAGEVRTTAGKRRQTDVRKLVHQLQGDLDWIVMKCLEKDRARRYETANGLATDIQRHLANEPVLARPPSAAYRLQKAWRRNKLVFTAGAVVAVALVAGIGVSTWQAVVATRARGVAVHAQKAAETARQEAESSRQQESALRVRAESAEHATEQQLYTALLEQARATVRSGELGQRLRALDAVQRAAAISNTAELRCEALAALMLPDLRFVRELPVRSDPRFALLDPAFERLVIGTGTGPVEILAVSDNRLLATLSASTNLPAFHKQWSADGRFLAAKRGYPDGRHGDWEVWDVAQVKRVLLLRNVSYQAFSFHPRLPQVIARIRDGVAIWSLEDGRELIRFPHAGRAVMLEFSPQGERFAVISATDRDWGRRLSVHDATNPETGELASCAFTNDTLAVEWHPDGRSLAVPDNAGAIHWVDAQTGNSETLGRHKSPRARAHFSADGANLFTVGWDQDLIWWNARTRRRMFTANLNSSTLQWNADGRLCAAKSESGVQLYELVQPVDHRELADDLGGRLQFAAISLDGRWLAASADKGSSVWDLSSAGPGAPITNAFNTEFYFTPDGRELFGSHAEGRVAAFRWQLTAATDPAAPPMVRSLPLRTPRNLTSLSLLSNDVVMTGSNGTRILPPAELQTGLERWTPTIPGINGVSPDGRWLGIRRHFGSELTVYRMPGLEQVAGLKHPTSFGDFEFSPTGDEVAISSRINALTTLWSTRTWERTHILTNCSRLLYTPDGRHLWLTRNGRKSGLYEARTLEPLLLLPAEMRPLALSPDARRVVMSVDMERLQVWDLSEIRKQLHTFGLDWAESRH